MLAEGAAVSGDPASTAGLQGGSAAIPTAGSHHASEVDILFVLGGRRRRIRCRRRCRNIPGAGLDRGRIPVNSQERALTETAWISLGQRKVQ